MKRGIFITLEGLDGSGKSVQAHMLEKELTKKGFPVLITREPGGTPVAEKIRNILLSSEIQPWVEALLFLAARISHAEEIIKPALRKGMIVLSSRYIDSSVAYQGFGLNLGGLNVLELNEKLTEGLWPDLTLYIKIDPELSMKRKNKDVIEVRSKEYFSRVYEGYNWLINRYPERMKVVDGTLSVVEVHREILSLVLSYMNDIERK